MPGMEELLGVLVDATEGTVISRYQLLEDELDGKLVEVVTPQAIGGGPSGDRTQDRRIKSPSRFGY